MAWNVEYDKQHAFKIFSDSNAFNALDNSITVPAPTDEAASISNFYDSELLNAEITVDGIATQTNDKIVNFVIDQSGSVLWNDPNALRISLTDRLANKFENAYSGGVSYNLFTFNGQKAIISSMAANTNSDPFNDLLPKEDCDVDLDNYRDSINRLAGIRLVRNAERYPQSPLDGEIVFEGICTKITDSNVSLGVNYYYKIFTFDQDLKFSPGKQFFLSPNNDSVPQGLDSLSMEFLTGIGANVDSNTLGSWQFNKPNEDYVYDFTGNNDLTVQSGMQWVSSAETALGESGIRLTDSYFSFTDTNDDLIVSPTGKVTIMAWVFPYDSGSDMSIINRGSSLGNSDYIITLTNSGALGVFNGALTSNSVSGIVTFNAWNFITVTIDFAGGADAIKYYVNGAFLDSDTVISPAPNVSAQNVYIGNDFSAANQFTGAISYISVHSEIKDADYILNRYLDAEAADQDNGDRLALAKGYIGNDIDYVGNELRVVFDRDEDPSLPDEYEIVYQNTSMSTGDFYFTHKTNFLFDEIYNYRVFVKDIYTGNYSHLDNSQYFALTPSYISQESQERKSLEAITVTGPESTLVINGNRKAYIKWGISNLDETTKQVRIYYSDEDYPIVDSNSAIPINESYTGELIFAGDPSLGGFLHQNIANDVYHYYTIVFSDGISYQSSGVNLVAIPTLDADETTIPLLDVSSISYEQVSNQSSVNIFWDIPYEQETVSGYFDEEFVFFSKVTDEFCNILDVDDFTVKASINSTFTKIDNQGEDVFNGVFSLNNPSESSLYQFVPSKFKDGVFKGLLSFPSAEALLNYKSAELEIVLEISIPDLTSAKNVNGDYTESIFTYKSKPFKVVAQNPVAMELLNLNNRKVELSKNNLISILDNQGIQEKVEFYGFYVGTSENLKIRVLMAQKNDPLVFPSGVRAEVHETRTDIFSGDNLQPRVAKFAEELIVSGPDIFQEEIDILDEDGNPTGEKITSTFADIEIAPPSYTVNLLVFIEVLFNGYRHVAKFPIVCASPLKIDLITRIPSSDGVSTEEQSALVYKVDPDDPTNIDARTLVPDGTPVIWTLNKGTNATIDRPFVSTSTTTPNFEVPENSVVSFTTNGIAKDIIFGPISEVEVKGYDDDLNPIFEQYDISADVFYDGMGVSAEQTVALVPLIFESQGLAGSYFLMEFADKQQKFYTDGISYAKLTISHDPNTAVTKYSSCFVECLNNLGKTIYTLSPGTGVQIATDDPNIEIVYGDVTEVVDPYTGRARLNTDDAEISYGSAIVPLENGDETHVYFRKNITTSDQYISSLIDVENPCDCLGLSKESLYNQEIKVFGSLTSIFNSNIETLTGGGSLSEGIPPTILVPQEPLTVNLAGIRVEDEFVDGLQIDGDAINELVFDVSFADLPVPNGVVIDAQVVNLTEDILALHSSLSEDSSSVTTTQRVESGLSPDVKSYASVKLRGIPRGKAFEGYLIVTANYDELGTEQRSVTSCFLISYNSDENTSAIVSNLFSKKLYSMNTAPLDASWTTLADMPIARGSFGLNNDGSGSLYAIGGINSEGVLSTCHKYSIGTNTWSEIEEMPTARFGFQSVYVSGKIYVFGGYIFNSDINRVEVSQSVEVFDTTLGTWSILTSMPSLDLGYVEDVTYGIANGTIQHISGNIYILSGVRKISEDGSFVFYNDRILTYNFAGDSWSWTDVIEDYEVSVYQRISPVSFVVSNTIYVLAGANQDDNGEVSLLSTTYSFDTSTSTLDNANADFTDIPSLRYKSANTFVASDRVYLLGGISNISKGDRAIQTLDLSSVPFADPADGVPELPEAIHDSGLAIESSILYSAGGNRTGNDKDMVIIDAWADQDRITLNSRDNLNITVELKNDDGNLITDTVTVVARGYVQRKDAEGLEQFLVSDDFAKYPVAFVTDRKTVTNGKTSFTLSVRSDDVLSELFETVELNEESFAERYKIIVELLIDSTTRFGKTILNTNEEGITVDQVRSDCVSIFNNLQIAQLNVSNTTSANSFSLIPFYKRQDESVVVDAVTENIWVNSVEKINDELVDYSQISSHLTDLSYEIPYGNSPLYNALEYVALELSNESYDGTEKAIYVFTDKEESFSSITIDEGISEVNAIDGPGEVPCVIGNISDVDYPSIYSLEKYTESNHLNQIASETLGQAVTIRNENLDDTILILSGKARGSLGYSNSKFVYDFTKDVIIKSLQVNYTLPANTGGYWYLSKSDKGQEFIDKSTRFSPNELIDVVDFKTRYIELDMHAFSGLSIDSTEANDATPTTGPPIITSIDVNYTPCKEDYIYVNPVNTPLDPSQVSVAVDSNDESDDNIDVQLGVSTASSFIWDDFDTDPEPAFDEAGKVFLLRRQGEVQDTVLEPLNSVDNYMFKTEYGSWHSDATVNVFNMSTGAEINSSKYSVYPKLGLIIFKEKQLDSLYAEINNASRINIAAKIQNSNSAKDYKLYGLGYLYTIRDSCVLVRPQDVVQFNTVEEKCLLLDLETGQQAIAYILASQIRITKIDGGFVWDDGGDNETQFDSVAQSLLFSITNAGVTITYRVTLDQINPLKFTVTTLGG